MAHDSRMKAGMLWAVGFHDVEFLYQVLHSCSHYVMEDLERRVFNTLGIILSCLHIDYNGVLNVCTLSSGVIINMLSPFGKLLCFHHICAPLRF